MIEIAEAINALHRAGWSVGDVAFEDATRRRLWFVTGHNGENLIRAEGATAREAWRNALRQARALGMLRSATALSPGLPL